MKSFLASLMVGVILIGGILFAGGGQGFTKAITDSAAAPITDIGYGYCLSAVAIDSLDGVNYGYWKVKDRYSATYSVLVADTGVYLTKWADTTGGVVQVPVNLFHWVDDAQIIFGTPASTSNQTTPTIKYITSTY